MASLSASKILQREHNKLEAKYKNTIKINPDLNRTLVSFQANKHQAGYRWYKFKEGYSSSLVSYYLKRLNITSGNVLDPFAGSGTSLFVASEKGLNSVGIELLPIGYEVMWVRRAIINSSKSTIIKALKEWITKKPWEKEKNGGELAHLNITRGAFSRETEIKIVKYIKATKKKNNPTIQRILKFALLCILENISFTRKDGQYLRWDHRSGRRQGSKPFDKGEIRSFNEAIIAKLSEILNDLALNNDSDTPIKVNNRVGEISLIQGSCLNEVIKLKSNQFNLIITSPPYCNRYDYTRTYALELVLSGIDEKKIRELRQAMLSCTVENKEKDNLSKKFSKGVYAKANKAFGSQRYLKEVLKHLEVLKQQKKLNNSGIVRMIRNYFYELCLLIFELARVMKKGGYFIMVNDNVRYAGIHLPVDLILSDFATDAGLKVIEIQALPRGKGNSSQQMGKHGRLETRKCVYVWQKL